jgi:hypothetical protein
LAGSARVILGVADTRASLADPVQKAVLLAVHGYTHHFEHVA